MPISAETLVAQRVSPLLASRRFPLFRFSRARDVHATYRRPRGLRLSMYS